VLGSDPDIRLADQLVYTLAGGTIAGFAGLEHDPRVDPCLLGRDGCLRRGYAAIAHLLPRGVITLPYTLINSMIQAGLKWGGEYGESKDPMHFEDPARFHDTCQKALQTITGRR
jgi:hypothetical protein